MSRGPRSYRPWGPAVDIDSSRTAIDRDDSRDHPPRPDADPDLPPPSPTQSPSATKASVVVRASAEKAQVVKPINGDPFIGMLETPVTSAPVVANFLSNLPAYRTGVSPLTRGVEVGLAHGFFLTGPSSSSVPSAPPSLPRSRASPAPAS